MSHVYIVFDFADCFPVFSPLYTPQIEGADIVLYPTYYIHMTDRGTEAQEVTKSLSLLISNLSHVLIRSRSEESGVEVKWRFCCSLNPANTQ